VSWPFDLYVVVLVPSLTVNVSVATMPRVSSEVLAVSGAVPVPIAGAPVVLVELDVPDELELEDPEEDDESPDDDEVVPLESLELVELLESVELPELPSIDARADCTAAVSWLLTRLRAVSLAMLAKPLDSLVDAPNIVLMVESVCAIDDAELAAWFQKLWSCCQNETLLTPIQSTPCRSGRPHSRLTQCG
jgi:hypothetical protein